MKSKKFAFTLVSVILIFSVIATACGSKDSGSGGSKTEFRMNIGSEPPSLDPAQVQDNVSSTVVNGLFEGLTRKDADGKVVPGVAESWDVSEDGLTYTFHLRDSKWSNGDPVTAGDFEYAWKRALDPNLKPQPSAYAYQLYYLKGAEDYNLNGGSVDNVGVKATDDKTLVVTLNAPTPYFDSLVGFYTYYPVHPSVKDNEAWAADAKTIIGNGPFKMGDWQKNNSISIVKNDNYYAADEIKFTKVTFSEVLDSATELSMYETDQLDWAGKPVGSIPTDQLETLKQTHKDELTISPSANLYYYLFNTTVKPFDNVKIRKALTLAINRQDIVDNVTKEGQVPAYGLVPPGINIGDEEYRSKVSGDFFKEDVEEAKKLLAEGLQEEGLSKMPTIKLAYNTNDAHKKIAEALAEMWRTNLGVDTSIENQEWGVFLDNRNSLNYEVARGGWGADYNDPMTFIDLFTSKSGNNNTGFANPEYDALVKKAYSTADQAVRLQAMSDAEKILMDEMPIAPVYYYTNVYMVKPGFKGITMDYKGDIDYSRGYYEGK
ncbi:peptide ABC transporter substrate-binding protein [Paenibacillus protaetiae]|uniref:Peptide ABC transporter substrate-binding protein n=1 Tax=Paenibacillus protaetiae TaxID=2509456 RepID=A0A4P6FB04_9BACL|nr:peptide ABC transporter substrate-binding protein [Paenibacillus protaetiae]QAY67698.1 peptide ABC transporter substrate-binding protein [Paenibacillus protaetiae]